MQPQTQNQISFVFLISILCNSNWLFHLEQKKLITKKFDKKEEEELEHKNEKKKVVVSGWWVLTPLWLIFFSIFQSSLLLYPY